MKEKGFLYYLRKGLEAKRQTKALVKIKDGDDVEMLTLIRSLIYLEDVEVTATNVKLGINRRAWLEQNLKAILVTPDSDVGKTRRKLIRQAGYPVYLCGEEDYDTCTIGINGVFGTIFAKTE